MKLNSKKVIVVLSSVLVIVVIFLSLNRENEETPVNTTKVEVDSSLVSTSTTDSDSAEVGKGSEDGIEDPNDEEYNEPILTPLGREIKPYTKPVPEQPDYEASRWNFIDTNNNKVHDYFEVLIVEEFEDDADVVEAFFTQARYHQTVLNLAQKGELDKDTLTGNLSLWDNSYSCLSKLYKDSEFYEEGMGMASIVDGMFDPYYNTPEKFELKDSYRKASHGIWVRYTLKDEKVSTCREYFNESLNWNIN